jgi:hypothetical protein
VGGPLSSIDTTVITDSRVTEELRQIPDMSIDQRKDMADFKEREADQAAQQAAAAREAIREEEQRIAREREQATTQQQQARQEQQQIAQERQEAGADQQALDQRQQAAEQQQQEASQRQEELDQRRSDLEEQRREAERQEAFAEQKGAEAQEERRQIALDQQAIISQEPPPAQAEGVLGAAILNPLSSLGRLVKLDPNTGRETLRSPLNTVNVRTIIQIDSKILAIAGENQESGAIRLVEINGDTLEMRKQGDDDIAPQSLLWTNGRDIYAVINTGENLYLARFNTDLVLQANSSITVHPFASALFSGAYIVTQRADGSAVLLNAGDLSERR